MNLNNCIELYINKTENKLAFDFKMTDYAIITDNNYDKFMSEILSKSKHNVETLDLKNKSIFRFPKITLPRNKFDLLVSKHNIKVTRDLDNADYFVISSKYIASLFKPKSGKILMVSQFIEWIDKVLETDSKLISVDSANAFKLFINLNNIDHSTKIVINSTLFHTYIYRDTLANLGITYYSKKTVDKKMIQLLLSSNNLLIDIDVNNLTLNESPNISEEAYFNLERMLKSTDKPSMEIALETLANSNINYSLDKIALLFYTNYHSLKANCSNWNNVNVKSLKNRLKGFVPYNNLTSHYYYDKLIKQLYAENQLTEFAFNIIAKDYTYFLNKIIANSDSSFIINISNINLNEKYQEQIIKNKLKGTASNDNVI
jgi:hypothetical protein